MYLTRGSPAQCSRKVLCTLDLQKCQVIANELNVETIIITRFRHCTNDNSPPPPPPPPPTVVVTAELHEPHMMNIETCETRKKNFPKSQSENDVDGNFQRCLGDICEDSLCLNSAAKL